MLMFALPFAFISRYAGWGDGATFSLSCLALVPLAEVSGLAGYRYVPEPQRKSRGREGGREEGGREGGEGRAATAGSLADWH